MAPWWGSTLQEKTGNIVDLGQLVNSLPDERNDPARLFREESFSYGGTTRGGIVSHKRVLQCPYCQTRKTFQEQGKHWYRELLESPYTSYFEEEMPTKWVETTAWLLSCDGCSKPLLELVTECCTLVTPEEWMKEELDRKVVFPAVRLAPQPVAGMPEEIARQFQEAAEVLPVSPPASAALLRLALERLCLHLGLPGKDLQERIGALVKKGLQPELEQGLEVVRVRGAHAVQAGQLDLRDDQQICLTLFTLLNLLVEELISIPTQMKRLQELLPEDMRRNMGKNGTRWQA
jgi:hypothetical protein